METTMTTNTVNPKTAEDYFAVIDDMKPAQRFFFGVEYLYYSVKAKLTKQDIDLEFLEATYQKHLASKAQVPSGEIVVKQLPEQSS